MNGLRAPSGHLGQFRFGTATTRYSRIRHRDELCGGLTSDRRATGNSDLPSPARDHLVVWRSCQSSPREERSFGGDLEGIEVFEEPSPRRVGVDLALSGDRIGPATGRAEALRRSKPVAKAAVEVAARVVDTVGIDGRRPAQILGLQFRE